MPVQKLSHYELLDKLGEGGMGALYRARDTRLNRTVAIKVLRDGNAHDPDLAQRLLQEARAASQLNDPRIVTIYEVDESPGREFIAMEYVAGEPLSSRVSRGPLPPAETARIALECAEALAAAHAAGIVHRDLKPANVMLTTSGHVKLLDFGLAKVSTSSAGIESAESLPTLEAGPRTRSGVIVGTPAYMSPEQVQGKPLDARSDVFSFGILLYELLTGKRPFEGGTDVALLAAILRDTPRPVTAVRPDAPRALARIAERCLEKEPDKRYESADALAAELRSCHQALVQPPAPPPWKRPAGLAVAAAVVLAVSAAGFFAYRYTRERAARARLAEVEELRSSQGRLAAYRVLAELRPLLAGDPEFERHWAGVNLPVTVKTEPEGVSVFIKDYERPQDPWLKVGVSPFSGEVPMAFLRWRFEKEGFDPLEVTSFDQRASTFRLAPKGTTPAGMARVPGGPGGEGTSFELPEFWLDVYEVTNRQYKEFVDQGGYRTPRYWQHPFVKDGRTLGFDEAMALLRDRTGRPGPSTWELESYPEGQADLPVSGVSWYEAAAYAAFAGKRLPTYHEWYRAAGQGLFSEILAQSNFHGRGPEKAGASQGMSLWGHYDMAGNVKEWVFNENAGEKETAARRFALGGAWNDSSYMFSDPDAADPFDRRPVLGFRCARSDVAPPPEALAPVEIVRRDYLKERPVGDEMFAVYARLFAYDKAPLDARSEGPDDEAEGWRMERLSFASAYGERVPARLYLPRRAKPPYQVVLYYPSGVAQVYPSAEQLPSAEFAFMIRSGRAVLCPVYQNTLERRRRTSGPLEARDLAIQAVKDARRAVDFVESRPDLDAARLGYFGTSLGAAAGVRLLPVEPRIRVAVLTAVGLPRGRAGSPELDRLNYAPRIRQPILMINGRDDFLFPLETSQRPLLALLGTPEKDKKLVLLDGGHIVPRSNDIIRETLDWFDRYLGPVSPN